MLENYFGVIEMVFSFGLIIGLCVWQLWSVESARKRMREEETKTKTKD